VKQDDISLNLVAITIFSLVMASLLGPLINLSPVVPAIAVAVLLGVAAIDTFGWQNQGSTLLIDWLAQFSAEHRDRILYHEAGHLLVAHHLGIPITGYSLTAWEAFRQGQLGNGGVQFATDSLEDDLRQGVLTARVIDGYCMVWMAGIAAETLRYGQAEGGLGDRQQIRTLFQLLRRSASDADQKQRWAILQAKTLLETHAEAYEALVEAMRDRQPVAACQTLLCTPSQPNQADRLSLSN